MFYCGGSYQHHNTWSAFPCSGGDWKKKPVIDATTTNDLLGLTLQSVYRPNGTLREQNFVNAACRIHVFFRLPAGWALYRYGAANKEYCRRWPFQSTILAGFLRFVPQCRHCIRVMAFEDAPVVSSRKQLVGNILKVQRPLEQWPMQTSHTSCSLHSQRRGISWQYLLPSSPLKVLIHKERTGNSLTSQSF